MPDTNPSPAVGDIAEIELSTLHDNRKVLARWDDAGQWWKDIATGRGWDQRHVTSVRPLRLVDADAVVIDPTKTEDRVQMLAHWLWNDGQERRGGTDWQMAAARQRLSILDRMAPAAVPDEGGGENDGPRPGDGWLDSYIRNSMRAKASKSEPPDLEVASELPSPLRTEEDRAFVLRTVADALATGPDAGSWYPHTSSVLHKAADRLSAPTTPGEAVSGVSGELSGTEGSAAACGHTWGSWSSSSLTTIARTCDVCEVREERSNTVDPADRPSPYNQMKLELARAEAARYKAAVEAVQGLRPVSGPVGAGRVVPAHEIAGVIHVALGGGSDGS